MKTVDGFESENKEPYIAAVVFYDSFHPNFDLEKANSSLISLAREYDGEHDLPASFGVMEKGLARFIFFNLENAHSFAERARNLQTVKTVRGFCII